MKVTIVQLKEYLSHCEAQKKFFNDELLLKSDPEQRQTHLDNFHYYQKEIARMENKIENYPL